MAEMRTHKMELFDI